MKKVIIPIVLLIPVSFIVLASFYQIVLLFSNNGSVEEQIHEIQEMVDVEIIDESSGQEREERTFLSVGFDELKKKNNEVVGWIQVPNTKVNYPIVKHLDNSYYLTHSFDKSENKAGWIFLDYRSSLSELGKNTIIYGHNRLDTSMFGSLKNLLDENVYHDTKEIYVSTEDKNYVYTLFSIYVVPTTDDYIKSEFEGEEYKNWIEMIQNRSKFKNGVSVDTSDKILTLSTCYKNTKKLVVHAKLIREQKR